MNTVAEADQPAIAPGRIAFKGRLDAAATARAWDKAMAEAKPGTKVDLAGLDYCDGSGAALLLSLEARGATLSGATPRVATLLDLTRKGITAPRAAPEKPLGFVSGVGAAAVGRVRAAEGSIAFIGETATSVATLLLRPHRIRWNDVMRHAEEAGTRALPLIVLLGFLFGLILSFQSAVPMRQFGAEIFVINLVAVSVFRELGPLLSSVILAGRSGSAFAAEIGTMKVNEEIDALTTMGLNPFHFLVVPRLIAAVVMMPVLITAMNIASVIGMSVVMSALGFPLVAIGNQIVSAARPEDITGGLLKGMVFGAVVAAIGCARGMATGAGPRAVGDSATAAVVGGIVSVVILDGCFAVLFYMLDL